MRNKTHRLSKLFHTEEKNIKLWLLGNPQINLKIDDGKISMNDMKESFMSWYTKQIQLTEGGQYV